MAPVCISTTPMLPVELSLKYVYLPLLLVAEVPNIPAPPPLIYGTRDEAVILFWSIVKALNLLPGVAKSP